MSTDLKDLYHRLILDRQKDPRGFIKREKAQFQVEAYNPVCGDQFTVYFDIEDHKITDISYHGYGCALSKASTSLLVEELAGTYLLEECQERIGRYLHNLKNGSEAIPPLQAALAVAKNFPGRSKCTTLSWDALQHFIRNYKN